MLPRISITRFSRARNVGVAGGAGRRDRSAPFPRPSYICVAHLNAISFPSIEELREYAMRPVAKFACICHHRIKGIRTQKPHRVGEKAIL